MTYCLTRFNLHSKLIKFDIRLTLMTLDSLLL
jgi:hypothetical protein